MPFPDLKSRVEKARGSLWVLPSISVCAAVVVGGVLSRVDVSDERFFSELLFPGGPEGARGMLQAVAASVITVTSLVFSLTVVTLQLASSQFSPRLLRTFLRQPSNQVVLSVFLATFVYSLVVLRTITADEAEGFVPALAVSVAFILVLASVAALVYFIHHITSEIRADTLMQRVEHDTLATLDRVHPEPLDLDAQLPSPPTPPKHAVPIPSSAAGIVQALRPQMLLAVASKHDLMILLQVRIGDRVVKDSVIGWAWHPGHAATPDLSQVTQDVNAAVTIGHERTMQQDVSYGIRQLVDMAAKGLSTGVNDPTTAVDATGHLSSILSVLVGRSITDAALTDDGGNLRVYVPRRRFEEYLDSACGQIRRYGCDEPTVCVALLSLLREVGRAALKPEQRELIEAQLDLVLDAARAEISQDADLQPVLELGEMTRDSLKGQRFVWVAGRGDTSTSPPTA